MISKKANSKYEVAFFYWTIMMSYASHISESICVPVVFFFMLRLVLTEKIIRLQVTFLSPGNEPSRGRYVN